MIRIRFVTGNDPISDAIRRAEYGFWATHAEAVLPDGSLLGAHAEGGVLLRPQGYDKGSFTRDMIVEIPSDQVQTDIFHAWLRSQLGKPYDFDAIAAFAASPFAGERNWQSPDSWYCSELVAAALV